MTTSSKSTKSFSKKLKNYELDISYEDLIKFTGTVKIKAKNKRQALKIFNKDPTSLMNKTSWEEESIGDGWTPEIDVIRENGVEI